MDDEPLVDAAVVVEEAWLVDVCVLESEDDAAAAENELYCVGSVTTEAAINTLVDIAPSASVTTLTWVTGSVV